MAAKQIEFPEFKEFELNIKYQNIKLKELTLVGYMYDENHFVGGILIPKKQFKNDILPYPKG